MLQKQKKANIGKNTIIYLYIKNIGKISKKLSI